MALLLDGVTEDTAGTGATHTGPCSVFVYGDLGKGHIELFAAPSDTAGEYSPAGRISRLSHPGSFICDLVGTYFLKASLVGATETADCTVETVQ
jgi:hypothetical protein